MPSWKQIKRWLKTTDNWLISEVRDTRYDLIEIKFWNWKMD